MNIMLVLAFAALLPMTGDVPVAPPTGNDPTAPFPVALIFGDVDGDSLDDVLGVDPLGRVTLWHNRGAGDFEDITLASGLQQIGAASCAVVADFDGDGDLDVFAGSAAERLWVNAGNASFAPLDSGLDHPWIDLGALALDFDEDGLLDLYIATDAGDVLYHNTDAKRFERVDLSGPVLPAKSAGTGLVLTPGAAVDSPAASAARRRISRWVSSRAAGPLGTGGGVSSSAATAFTATSIPSAALAGGASIVCANTLVDQALGNCIEASSIPTLGDLYPLTTNLNVSTNGDVGIGTTSPSEKLHVAGNARVVGTITATNLLSVRGLRTSGDLQRENVVGGYFLNNVLDGAYGATIGGGGTINQHNWVADGLGTVAGGAGNHAGTNDGLSNAWFATVGGGENNESSGRLSTVGGGESNDASGSWSTVSGGRFNIAEGDYSAVPGGDGNRALGAFAFASGGSRNIAEGDWSWAGGRGAVALEHGSFVWADSAGAAQLGVQFLSTGVDQFLIRASGGVGIGTNAPEAPMHVFEGSAGTVMGSTNASAVFERDGANYVQLLTPDADESGVVFGNPSSASAGGIYYNSTVANGLAFRCNGNSTKMVLNQNGRLGVGTSSPSALLHVAQAGNPIFRMQDLDAGGPSYHFGIGSSDDSLRISESGVADRVVIERTSGNVGIGTSSPVFLLHVNGTAGKPGGGSWSVASDARLKTNVRELDGALAKLMALRGVTFEYVDPQAIGELEGQRTGFIAQEVEAVFPDWVEDAQDGYKRLSIRGFEAMTVEALRELSIRHDEALAERDARIADLEAQLASHAAQLEELRAALTALAAEER